ncbi:MAG: hypothetical protein VW057_14085 [Rhodospirillaceae bacterium]
MNRKSQAFTGWHWPPPAGLFGSPSENIFDPLGINWVGFNVFSVVPKIPWEALFAWLQMPVGAKQTQLQVKLVLAKLGGKFGNKRLNRLSTVYI